MRIRKRFLPRAIPDAAATSFLLLMIPVTFWFEMWVVIPALHGSWTPFHIFYFGLGCFCVFNIVSNLLAIMMCDTSLSNQLVQPPPEAESKGWHLCATCEAVAPPRSWHCSICRACILKRDHHCIFSGCCIGFHNHRYFMMLLFWLSLATALCALYNSYFIWFVHATDWRTWTAYARIVFPLAWLAMDFSVTDQYYFLIYVVAMIGAFLTNTLLFYHCSLIRDGTIVHERTKKLGRLYDVGPMENMRLVLGERWYLTWISPFVSSTLPHDGIHWENVVANSNKNR